MGKDDPSIQTPSLSSNDKETNEPNVDGTKNGELPATISKGNFLAEIF